MIATKGYAAHDAKSPLEPYDFSRRELGSYDVLIDILFCGICHSDIHTARGEWKGVNFPVVPGHEIIGKVKKTGDKVQRFHEGQIVGVGCMVGSCGKCEFCHEHLEQFCIKGATYTYGGLEPSGDTTKGGYADNIIVNENFVFNIPDNLDLASAAPLLCAGITTYSPLKHWKVGKGSKVGIIGLGGLGHVAVKIARALGAHVVVFTTSPEKRQDALELGANEVVVSKDSKEMAKLAKKFDFILDTVSAPHDLESFMNLVKVDGTLCMVGASPMPHEISSNAVVHGRKSLAGSLIGGTAETQELLDFCGKNNITCNVEVIPIQQVNEAYDRVVNGDIKYRFVIDMKSLQNSTNT